MVVSVSPEASDAGREILRQGGSAVDAAVATAFALAVTFPEAGNIGGGGFMIVAPPEGEPVCVDYRETAPARASREMFAGQRDGHTHLAVGVPGTVRGLATAHEKFGKLRWSQLVGPAIRLATDGFAVDRSLAQALNEQVRTAERFPELRRVFARPNGKPWQAGDRLIQQDLARTLQRIADGGPQAFYQGPIADQLVAEMKAGGGLIDQADLSGYAAVIRTPVHGTYRGFDLYCTPPPSSGGTCIIEMLNILENFDLQRSGRWSPETVHLVIEAMRRAYCDRARYLGDPAFVEIPSRLITKEYARELSKTIDLNRATSSESLAPEIELAGEGTSTTHFSVVDSNGLAVSNTYTLQDSYGSRIVVRGGGYLLNNEMTDFNWRPGYTDREGKIGTAANVIAPGKRMLSSQSPVVVRRDGRTVFVTGSPGGRTIPNTVLCVLLDRLEFGLDVGAAVDGPRLHHAWFPDSVRLEPRALKLQPLLVEKLTALGHQVKVGKSPQGDAHSIEIRDGIFRGAADERRTAGKASGY
jgi:gamma-glutamyltranspeptidase/glutathione hydrolase